MYNLTFYFVLILGEPYLIEEQNGQELLLAARIVSSTLCYVGLLSNMKVFYKALRKYSCYSACVLVRIKYCRY